MGFGFLVTVAVAVREMKGGRDGKWRRERG